MVIDVHCHYTFSRLPAQRDIERFSFEPADGNEEPAYDSFISPRQTKRFAWWGFQWLLGIRPARPAGPEFDREIERIYERHLLQSTCVDRFVLLAFDAYHDRHGRRPPPPEYRGQFGGDIYTSNSLVRAACRAHPDRYLFGASVHPYRENAVANIEEVFAAGACLIKWLPLHQNIDITDPRTIDVLRCCARLGLPVLAHYSQEFTLTTQHPEFVSIEPLLLTLRRLRHEDTMPITIVAHVATPVTPLGEEDSHRMLLDALTGEFADAPLYADLSALTTWGKIKYLREMARRQDLHAKLLFGTDFPVPLWLPRLKRDLGRDYREIASLPSWPDQVLRTYRRMCFNEIVFHRAEMLLPNVAVATRL